MNKKFYTAPEIARKFNITAQTVYSRFKSPYAGTRWGVVAVTRLDGSIVRAVPEDQLIKWFVERNSYVGRPTTGGVTHE